jgi:mannose-6-phosphate isomerase-like protein (cupin superfamily)
LECEEVSPGVIKRTLLKPENNGKGPPGELKVEHYSLFNGGKLTLDNKGLERQDFIISGALFFGRRYIFGNTTIFSPSGGKVSYTHDGETEARLVSTTYSVPHKSHKWCKTRVSTLKEDYEEQLMTEEFHALTGAHRFHAIDIQTWDREPHRNPEETAYFLRGERIMTVDDESFKVRPGSLVYSEEGALHGVKNTGNENRLQYYVMEYTEQDKMWSMRSFNPKVEY